MQRRGRALQAAELEDPEVLAEHGDRDVREQVDWDDVRDRTVESPFARAFFTLVEGLGIVGDARPPQRPTAAQARVKVAVEGEPTAAGAERAARWRAPGRVTAHEHGDG